MAPENKKIDWDTLLYAIRKEKCVLFIGPEIAQTKDGQYFNKALYESLREDHKDNTYYFSRDDLFIIDNKDRITVLSKIDKFLQNSFNKDLYTKIAFVPFHLIISASPDLFLKKTFDDNNLQYEYHYYNYSETRPEEFSDPTREIPVLYNMTGCTDDSSSLLITYKDLYKYLKAILGTKPLPTELLNELKSVTRFLFLGFKFEKWYVQLLLALLYDEIEKDNNEGLAPLINISPEADEICTRQFNISFIASDYKEFVDELYSRCQKDGMLREAGKEEVLISKRAMQLIKKDEVDDAIDLLFNYLEDSDQDKYDRIAGISARYNRVKRRLNEGVLDQKEANIELNKINAGLLDLIEDVKLQENAVRT